MISLSKKEDCCGCNACVQLCTQKCIKMVEDEQGFLYPKVDINKCCDCGLCESICPVINYTEPVSPIECYASFTNEESKLRVSSSGGVFYMLAEHIISNGGVVFGAAYDSNWTVYHTYVDSLQELPKIMGSKYVQSQIGDSFIRAKDYLRENRLVLFSGTPCQISALKKFLRKQYVNLLTVECVCHGVPSPGVFRWYLDEVTNNNCSTKIPHKDDVLLKRIKHINFRDKTSGWNNYKIKISFSDKDDIVQDRYTNPYLYGFLSDAFLRPSCYKCPSKRMRSGADFILGDFWGIKNYIPSIDDSKGVSAVIINTYKGMKYKHILQNMIKVPFEWILLNNKSVVESAKKNKKSKKFWQGEGLTFIQRIENMDRRNIFIKYLRSIYINLLKIAKR